MSQSYEAGDVKLISVKLVNGVKNATVDIRAQCASISIYEDMEEPTVYVEINMVDSINLVKDFPIIGEEDLEIAFVTPSRDKITTYKFTIFSVEGTSVSTTGKASVYTLKGVTKEHFTNSKVQVEKTYNTTVDEMVLDVLANEIKTSRPINVEATRGLYKVTVPRSNPFEAIDLLRQKAIAKRPSGGVFVFYENQHGFNFTSIERLLEEGMKTIGSRIFTYAPTTNTDKAREAFSFRNIQRYQHLSKFDTIDKMSGGLFKNTSRHYDLQTKEFRETVFELDKQLTKFETGEKKAVVPNSNKLINDAKEGSPYYMFAAKDSSKGNDYVSDFVGYRRAFTKLFNQNVTRVMVYGDNYLAVGDMVTLELPDTSGTTEKKTKDQRFSGNYMITKLRHLIIQEDKKFKHHITFDCNKAGYNS
jgi:hypothetical protein